MKETAENPFLKPFKTKYETIPFDKIEKEHFMPAFDKALQKAEQEIEAIKQVEEEPSFANTIVPFETSGELLNIVTQAYFILYSSESDDEFKSLAQEISPKLAAYQNKILLDKELFSRIKHVYDDKKENDLNKEQRRLLEEIYMKFVRNGANLKEEDKKKLREIDRKLSKLSPKFSQNLLASTNQFKLHIKDEKKLAGLPDSAIESAAEKARENGKDQGWMFTLQLPSVQPVLKYANDRELRKTIGKAYGARAYKDKFDNREILKRIAALRQERAELLGYKTHADYILERRMARNLENVEELLENVYEVALPKAKEELDELKQYALEIDNIDDFSAWDLSYYAEKLKKKKFEFEEEQMRPYLKVENVVDGVFKVAKKLYDLNFEEENGVPVYHDDLIVYRVLDKNKDFVGLLYVDLFPRETKRSGAWMSTYRVQGLHGKSIKTPQVSVNANLTPSTKNSPSLLTLDETRTIFHEFGHALHALLSDCTYTTLASPNVYWDFVELPSQILENWLYRKETLDLFARHYKTGEKIPAELVEKVKAIEKFNKGWANIRQLSFNYLDLGWHANDTRDIEDVTAYEKKLLQKTQLLPRIEGTNRSCSFAHIFAGGYAAGYYSYKWAEVLEADAFQLFKENGIFDRKTAESFKNIILARGNSEDPLLLFKEFRGREPDPDALLKKDGLI